MSYSPNLDRGNDLEQASKPPRLSVRHQQAETQALYSRIAAVNEIAIAINRTLNLDEILRVVGKQAKWLLDFEHCSVCLQDKDGEWQLVTLFGSPVKFDANIPADSPLSYTLRTGQSQKLRKGSTAAFLSAYASQLILALESDRQIIGTINFAITRAQAYTQEDLRIGYLLALQLSAAIRNARSFEQLNLLYAQLETEKRNSERTLLNILPVNIAEELKLTGKVKPVHYESASVLFTDFKDFTRLAEQLSPQELVDELDYCFSHFDRVIETHNLEKLKTIGDSYMCVGGIPLPNRTHAIDTVLAALQIQAFTNWRRIEKIQSNRPYWEIRIGINSGSLLAGVIGQQKFAYDVWGDTVNIASRMESSGISGQINISKSTYDLVKSFFKCEHRGKINAKNKGDIDMYIVTGLKQKFSIDPLGLLPNDDFNRLYAEY